MCARSPSWKSDVRHPRTVAQIATAFPHVASLVAPQSSQNGLASNHQGCEGGRGAAIVCGDWRRLWQAVSAGVAVAKDSQKFASQQGIVALTFRLARSDPSLPGNREDPPSASADGGGRGATCKCDPLGLGQGGHVILAAALALIPAQTRSTCAATISMVPSFVISQVAIDARSASVAWAFIRS